MSPWSELLEWWFGSGQSAAEVAASRTPLWFGYRPEQDDEARERFGELCQRALAGELGEWPAQAESWLALLLLLDQLPRMIYRNTPSAFAGDARAQYVLRGGLDRGLQAQLPAIRQVFAYLVLEHAEDMAAQDQAVERFAALHAASGAKERKVFAGYLDYAERHRDVIRRFARFPHRNAILGRVSTAEELAFLQQPGSRF